MQHPTVYDIAVTGGGLAGLALAIQAVRAGYSVVLFEKENYPFHKVCGEYISLESWEFIESLGVPLNEWNLPVIKNFHASDAQGRLYKFDLPLGGFGVSRYLLDYELYQIALAQGVTIFTNTKVSDILFSNGHFIIRAGGGTYTSRIAAGSFGKRSNLDIKWKRPFIKQKHNKLNNYIGVKYHIRYEHAADTIALHNFQDGYCGISRIENDRSCLCYLTTADNLKKNNGSISQLEQQVLGANPRLREIFTNAEFLWDHPLIISQISFAKKSQIENHVLLMGDAAGMITPLCGNGMSMALHASKLAFQCMDTFLLGKSGREQMEQHYNGFWRAEFSKRLWMGRMVQRVFGCNTSTAMFFKTMKMMPAFAAQVIKSTHGTNF